ncbi:MAG: NUDIX domain-containing protein [Sphingomonadales bacterium]|nr:NUDIX domain-containing protein [Sphingomonadales bacterium]
MSDSPRRIRRAARVILLGPDDRTLLFRFTPEGRPPFWTAPGGECDPGESFADAARRELLEETGIQGDPVPLDLVLKYDFLSLSGEPVRAEEHFFHWRTPHTTIETGGHTELERAIMLHHRWFALGEIGGWAEAIYPVQIVDLVTRIVKETA